MAAAPGRNTLRVLGRLLTLLALALIGGLLAQTGPLGGRQSAAMLLGFLLLAAFLAGEIARGVYLPRITGYLVIGILFGPSLLGLVPESTVSGFQLIDALALSVIALQAGGELRMSRLRPRLLRIGTLAVVTICLTMLGVMVTVYVGRSLFPFLDGRPDMTVLAVALIFGVVSVALSPAATIAVLTEIRARGVLSDTVLSVSVLVDVVILVLIAVLVPTAVALTDPSTGFDVGHLREIGVAILVSLAVGAVIGGLLIIYIHRVGLQLLLLVLAAAYGVVELAHVVGLPEESYILMSMSAGFVVGNLSRHGERFLEAIEFVSVPIYALFFAVAGAALDLSVMPRVWAASLLLLAARTVCLAAGARLSSAVVGDSPVIRRYAWLGMISQAGVALGLASIVQDRFEWGVPVGAIVVAMIAVNQLVGPPLFRFALVKAGEAMRRPSRLSIPDTEQPVT